MSKSYSRDIQVLFKIVKYVDKIRNYLKKNNVKDLNSFIGSEDCRDMCSFCILQISELGKQLTKETYNSIPYFMNGSIIPIRNMIAHDYLALQVPMLYNFVVVCVSKENHRVLQDRIMYCKQYKRK